MACSFTGTKVLTNGSLLEGFRSYPSQFLMFCWHYLHGDCNKTLIRDCNIGENTVVRLGRLIRLITVEYETNNPLVLQGEIEIDESIFRGKRKYNRGSVVQGYDMWCFGAIEKNCREGEDFKRFKVCWVCDRKKETLLPLIAEWCAPGSKIESDGWAAYRDISGIQERSFTHKVVNHSQNFKDPVNGACTNTVEGKNNINSEFSTQNIFTTIFSLKKFPQPNRQLEAPQEGGSCAMSKFP